MLYIFRFAILKLKDCDIALIAATPFFIEHLSNETRQNYKVDACKKITLADFRLLMSLSTWNIFAPSLYFRFRLKTGSRFANKYI